MAHKDNDKHSHAPDRQQNSEAEFAKDMDSGSKALADALRMSFAVLKLIMIVLVILFFASGIFTVEKNEKALVLRFGKILTDAGGDVLLEPGLHWSMPYPIDEIVKIPVSGTKKLELDSFWYFDPSEGRSRVPKSLNPVRDNYCLTRNEPVESMEGNDYNIVHCKWQLNYTIENSPFDFFKNVKIRDIKPGEIYSDVIAESLKPLLKSVCDNAVITTLVKYSIDQATTTSKSMIATEVAKKVQKKLTDLDTGILVKDMQILAMTWPRQVDDAFEASIKASQNRKKIETDAWSYYENVMNETAGPYAEEIYKGIMDENASEQELDRLWDSLAGNARNKIADARAYRTTVVENAKANADYLMNILPEYQKRPDLVLQKIYQDTLEEVLANVDEKIIVQPTRGEQRREFRVLINRDPKADKKNDSND